MIYINANDIEKIKKDIKKKGFFYDLLNKKIEKQEILNIDLEKIKGNSLYFIKNNNLYKAELFSNNYYKLAFLDKSNIPVLEINGLRMQLLKGFSNPLEYAKISVEKCFYKKKIKNVFETCFGLGYVTCELLKRNSKIISCEISNEVLNLAKINPFSNCFNNENLNLFETNCFFKIQEYNLRFDLIFHDPPRISLAGELYSTKFYENCFLALKNKGLFFHYVGYANNRNIQKSVEKRLLSCGFSNCFFDEKTKAVFAIK